MPVLIIKRDDGDAVVTMSEGVPVFVGRAPECDIHIPDAEVSRRHAVFIIKNNLCGVKDLGSFNGTYLNGTPITQPRQLLDGDTIDVATHNITYMLAPPEPKSDSAAADNKRKRRSTRLVLPRAASDTSVRRFLKEVKTIGDNAKRDHGDTRPRVGQRHTPTNGDTVADLSDPQVTARLLAALGGDAAAQTRSPRAARSGGTDTVALPAVAVAETAVEAPPEPDPTETPAYPSHEGTTAIVPTPPILSDLEEMPISTRLRRAVEDRIRLHFGQSGMTDEHRTEGLAKLCCLAYTVMASEPLAVELSGAGVEHEMLLGGAAYYLTLETLRDETAQRRSDAEWRLSMARDGAAETSTSAIFRLMGRVAKSLAKVKAADEELVKLEWMLDEMIDRAAWLGQEIAFLERTLIREFWRVYTDTAVRFLPREGEVPLAVRAFLRYGAVGFNPWWMQDDVRQHIIASCEKVASPGARTAANRTMVLHADEYLAAVSRQECAPSENDETRRIDRNSAEWRAERSLRKKIASTSYLCLLEEKAADYKRRLGVLTDATRDAEKSLSAPRPGNRNGDRTAQRLTGDLQYDLADRKERRNSAATAIKCLEADYVSPVREKLADLCSRFQKRELQEPSRADLIRRECAALAEQSQRLAGPRNRFLPIVTREHFLLGSDVVNDRDSTAALLQEYEKLDPAIFVDRIGPAAKKANRMDIRLCPITVIIPSAGLAARVGLARDGMERGHLIVPMCFSRQDIRRRQFAHMLADYRWETARKLVGNRDLMSSDTLAGAFMSLRWEWRALAKEKRERGLIFNELSDHSNWRRVYELYLVDAAQGGKRLYSRNPECYSRIIGKYIELPEGVAPLWKTAD